MSKLYFQDIIEDISLENLPVKWQAFDFVQFSQDKKLFGFQTQGLHNAVKGLWLYYIEHKGEKKSIYKQYLANGFTQDFDYDLKKKEERKSTKYLLEYDTDYPATNNKISFAHFINRMSFWMATGSGKTLIIVKLIELLGKLITEKEIPDSDILFLAHRDDLLEQFKNHVNEYNSFHLESKINLKNLRDYENVKHENALPFNKNEITVFYYRSDLISDEQKEKIVNYKNYDNKGQWYVLLDEAHKGDKEDSKRQILYSILSRNGFLFNFSATFTDPRDFATCAYNFNLSRFVEEGYGKHIYLSSAEINAFRKHEDFSPLEKQKIVLKALLLLTYINKYVGKIKEVDKVLYHRPLLLTLVNSVDTDDSDLELFFAEIDKIARKKIRNDLFQQAKKEIIEEIEQYPQLEFEEMNYSINPEIFNHLEYKDILIDVFNSTKPGTIEVLKIPGNRQELVFKLKTAEKPFALIKIGDISGWLKNKLEGYEINESFENEGYFRRLNQDDSDINILMGSRSFYEGWDSNRPNLLLFVNIGIGTDAKKFVLQAIGRGVRIEPLKNKRKRLQNLYNAREIPLSLFEKIKDYILPIESLLIFGTKAANLEEIIRTLKEEKQDMELGSSFILNPQVQKRSLLIPVYKTSERILAEENDIQKYSISRDDYDITAKYYKYLGNTISLIKFGSEIKVLNKIEESFSKKDQYYDFSEENSLYDPELSLSRIISHFNIKNREFDKFTELDDEIIHFKKVKFRDGEKYEEIKKKIGEMRHFPERQKELDEQYGKIPRKEFQKQLSLFEQAGNFEMNDQKVRIKYLANHYYLPVIVSNMEKIDYINHIITADSEVKFMEQLEEYLNKTDNVFSKFDWWLFSKLDQTLDEVSIPYYDSQGVKMSNFYPDFIFWAQKGKRYLILFVDPKGTEYADGYRKIDGYSRIFEIGDIKNTKEFQYNGYKIKVKLLLKPKQGIASVPDNYRKYWFDNFDDFTDKIF